MRGAFGGALWALGLGAVLALARLGELRPFGIAFFFSTLALKAPVRAAAALGVVAGAALGSPPPAALTVLACVAVGWAAALTPGWRRQGRTAAGMAAAAAALARLAGGGLGLGRPPLWWVETLGEAAAAGLLVQLWAPLWSPTAGASAEEETGSGLAGHSTAGGWLLLASGLALGLQPVGLGPLRAAAVVAPMTTMMASALGGAAAAAPAAAVTGGLLAMGDARWGLYGLALALGGAGAGLAPRPSRAYTALTVVAAVAAAGLVAPSREWVLWATGHGLAGAVLFCLLPGRLLTALERRLGQWPLARAGSWAPAADDEALRRQAGWVGERAGQLLQGLSALVSSLSAAYEAAAATGQSERGQAVQYVERVERRACEGCPSLAHCWQRHGRETFWEVLQWLQAHRAADHAGPHEMPAGLASRCLQPVRLAAAVRDVAEIARAELGAGQAIQAEHARLQAELQAVVSLLEEGRRALAGWLEEVDPHASARIGRHLRRLGLEPQWVWVSGRGGRREVHVSLRGRCPWPGECAGVVRRAAEEVEGVGYQVRTAVCRSRAPEPPSSGCQVALAARPRLAADVAFRGRPRGGQEVSGDRFARCELGPSRLAVVLSDGMGSGPEAARESEAAVRLVESALMAGADAPSAIRCANAALLARAPDDRFATLDVAVVDMAAGELELVKAGAYPSFAWLGGDLERLEGHALPAGIVGRVEVEALRRPVGDGDWLVMVTDGAAHMGAAGERLIQQELSQAAQHPAPAVGARELAQRILGGLQRLGGDGWPDDVTVAVVRFYQLDGEPLAAYSEVGLVSPARVQTGSRQRRRRGLGART